MSQVLASILPEETLLWKLKMLKSASAFANSRLHAVKAQTLLLTRSYSLHNLSHVSIWVDMDILELFLFFPSLHPIA
jgi:hypothetical protein